jgi:hypothetical protein
MAQLIVMLRVNNLANMETGSSLVLLHGQKAALGGKEIISVVIIAISNVSYVMNMGILPNSALNWLVILRKLMLILHLIMSLPLLLLFGFLIQVQIIISEPYLGNDHLHIGDGQGLVISNIAHSKIHSPDACLLYPIFYMFLPLKNLCYLFKNFVLTITSFLNFIPLYFMLKIS